MSIHGNMLFQYTISDCASMEIYYSDNEANYKVSYIAEHNDKIAVNSYMRTRYIRSQYDNAMGWGRGYNI